MKKLKGNEIINFLFCNNEFSLKSDFIIELDKTEFEIETDFSKYDNIEWDFRTTNEINRQENLHCVDNKGNQFTLLDCYICPLNIPCTKVKVIWNSIIYGLHISNYNQLFVDRAVFKIDNKKYTYRISIGKNKFAIENDTIEVNTTWGKKQYKHRYDGVVVEFNPIKSMLLLDLIKSFNLLLEIYFLQIGYFPDTINTSFRVNKKLCFMVNPNKSNYSSKANNVRLETRLFLSDSDYSLMYSNYKILDEVNSPLFNMFYNNQSETNNFMEVDTFVYIQCLESYYTSFNKSYALFKDDKRKEISKLIFNILKDNSELNQVIESVYSNTPDFYDFLNGMLSNINKKSLKKIINDVFESELISLVMKYEIDNNIIKKFKNKIYKHRNFIAHINKDLNARFIGEENKLAQDKFKLIFRLCVLSDIGANIEQKQLQSCIEDINRWYKLNKLN